MKVSLCSQNSSKNTFRIVLFSSFATSLLTSCCGAFCKLSHLRGEEINIILGFCIFFQSFAYVSSNEKICLRKSNIVSYSKACLNGIIFMGGYWSLFFVAFEMIPYGDMSAIINSSMFLLSVSVEIVKLKRRPSTLTCLASMFSFSGLVLFAQPNKFGQNYSGSNGWTSLLGKLPIHSINSFFARFNVRIERN